jgi:hypothetical protein
MAKNALLYAIHRDLKDLKGRAFAYAAATASNNESLLRRIFKQDWVFRYFPEDREGVTIDQRGNEISKERLNEINDFLENATIKSPTPPLVPPHPNLVLAISGKKNVPAKYIKMAESSKDTAQFNDPIPASTPLPANATEDQKKAEELKVKKNYFKNYKESIHAHDVKKGWYVYLAGNLIRMPEPGDIVAMEFTYSGEMEALLKLRTLVLQKITNYEFRNRFSEEDDSAKFVFDQFLVEGP